MHHFRLLVSCVRTYFQTDSLHRKMTSPLCNLHILSILLWYDAFSSATDERMTKTKFSVPKLTEEETESNFLPLEMRCDACLALVYQIKARFSSSMERIKSKKLRESDVIDILDKLCTDGFEEYGLKEVNEIHRLSGPGLDGAAHAGMVQMGGKWPRRIRDLCQDRIGEIGEMKIYSTFGHESSDLKQLLCEKYCSLQSGLKSEL